MLNYRSEEYLKNNSPVDKGYKDILGTPVNDKYSALIYGKLKVLDKIHKGGFCSQDGIWTTTFEGEDGQVSLFAQKLIKTREALPGEENRIAIETIQKFHLAKRQQLETFDEMFIYKGKYIITTLLADKKNMVLALNRNNQNLPIVDEKGKPISGDDYIGQLEIQNVEQWAEQSLDLTMRSCASKLYLWQQCLWNLVDSEQFRSKKLIKPKPMIGDYDAALKLDEVDTGEINKNIRSVSGELKQFVRYFCKPEYVEEYCGIIDNLVEKRYRLMPTN